MAFYNRNEVQSILLKLASERKDYKFIKYEKLGVVSEKSENFPNENQILKKIESELGEKTADMGNQQQYKNTLNGK